jgi:hypothetical protein
MQNVINERRVASLAAMVGLVAQPHHLFSPTEHLQFQLFEPFDSDEADLFGKNCMWSFDSLLGAHIRLILATTTTTSAHCFFFFICS